MRGMAPGDIAHEVERIHRFFADWFAGRCERSESVFEAGCVRWLHPDFELIVPDGDVVPRAPLLEGIFAQHGTNPEVSIYVTGVEVFGGGGEVAVARYTEWQEGARHAIPPENGRHATAVFSLSEGLAWRVVHESWLPPEVMAEGPANGWLVGP